jgi:hypothetical protein
MFDPFFYDLQDLFRIRDACVKLAGYELHNPELLAEVNKEILRREREQEKEL